MDFAMNVNKEMKGYRREQKPSADAIAEGRRANVSQG
jgi:hypothetical protein